jgi:ABC-type uncharacterized transport system permease subunit
LAYGANLIAQVVSSGLGLGASLLFLGAVLAHTETLGGWRAPDLLAVLGAFYVLTGLLGAIVQPSLQVFIDDILRFSCIDVGESMTAAAGSVG